MAFNDNKVERVEKIQTFVFLDIETTGLANLAFGKCAITELAMWATRREDLQQSSEASTRRLLNKWTLVFNPAMPICNDSTLMTANNAINITDEKSVNSNPWIKSGHLGVPVGAKLIPLSEDVIICANMVLRLDNLMLENYSTFDSNTCDAIITYLNHFPKPICFIAHYGHDHDYPIIRKSFAKRGKTMPDFVVCCDSWPIFKEIDNMELNKCKEQNAKNDDLFVKGDRSIDELSAEILLRDVLNSNDAEFKERQRINETTPPTKLDTLKRAAYKRYPDDDKEPSTASSNQKVHRHNSTTLSPQKSFKLPHIYERVFHRKPLALHTAEGDVQTLYELVQHFGNNFVDLADKNAVRFSCENSTSRN